MMNRIKEIILLWLGGRQIILADEFLEIRAFGSRKRIPWTQVSRIIAQKVNRVTYDEICLQVESIDAGQVTICELDEGFDSLVEIISNKFPTVEAGWREIIEKEERKDGYIIVFEA